MAAMRATAVIAVWILMSPSVWAVDGISLELGISNASNTSVDIGRIGVQWDWAKRWALGERWEIGGYWDVSFGHWVNDSPDRTSSSISEVSLTPVFRLQQSTPSGISPYVEAAIGFHLLSETSVSEQRRFGSSFQFGDHLGIGVRFGHRHTFDLGYFYQHLSNAGIKSPNQGINFHQLRVQYRF